MISLKEIMKIVSKYGCDKLKKWSGNEEILQKLEELEKDKNFQKEIKNVIKNSNNKSISTGDINSGNDINITLS